MGFLKLLIISNINILKRVDAIKHQKLYLNTNIYELEITINTRQINGC